MAACRPCPQAPSASLGPAGHGKPVAADYTELLRQAGHPQSETRVSRLDLLRKTSQCQPQNCAAAAVAAAGRGGTGDHAEQVDHGAAAQHDAEREQHPGQVGRREVEDAQEAQIDILVPPAPHVHLRAGAALRSAPAAPSQGAPGLLSAPAGGAAARTIMNVSEEPRNWMFTKGAMTVSSVPPARGARRASGGAKRASPYASREAGRAGARGRGAAAAAARAGRSMGRGAHRR